MLHRKSTHNTPVTYAPLNLDLFVAATVPPISFIIGTGEILLYRFSRHLVVASIKPDWVLGLSILNSVARYLKPL